MALGRGRKLFDELGQAATIVPAETVELIPHVNAQGEREARQIAMMALQIAPLPFRTSHRHGELRIVVTRITPLQRNPDNQRGRVDATARRDGEHRIIVDNFPTWC